MVVALATRGVLVCRFTPRLSLLITWDETSGASSSEMTITAGDGRDASRDMPCSECICRRDGGIIGAVDVVDRGCELGVAAFGVAVVVALGALVVVGGAVRLVVVAAELVVALVSFVVALVLRRLILRGADEGVEAGTVAAVLGVLVLDAVAVGVVVVVVAAVVGGVGMVVGTLVGVAAMLGRIITALWFSRSSFWVERASRGARVCGSGFDAT